MIKRYLNEIDKFSRFSMVTFKDEVIFRFLGDGTGDYEDVADDTSEECLVNYIDYCRDQIVLAQEYLAIKRKNT